MSSFSNADNNLHAPNENCDINYYVRGIKYAASIVAEFAG
jgi:acetylornithine deacetylase/succinyl-diaminopimelate desuccinylase-like protein